MKSKIEENTLGNLDVEAAIDSIVVDLRDEEASVRIAARRRLRAYVLEAWGKGRTVGALEAGAPVLEYTSATNPFGVIALQTQPEARALYGQVRKLVAGVPQQFVIAALSNVLVLGARLVRVEKDQILASISSLFDEVEETAKQVEEGSKSLPEKPPEPKRVKTPRGAGKERKK